MDLQTDREADRVGKAARVSTSNGTGKLTTRSRAQAARTRVVLAKKLGVSTSRQVAGWAEQAPVK